MKLPGLALVFAVLLLGLASAAQAQPNGYTANFARYDGGTVEQSLTGAWHEYKPDGSRHSAWRETGRDEWSVYLRDDSRNMDMQIDLYRKWISLAWPGHPMQDQWPIVEARSVVNGRTVSQVQFEGGAEMGTNGDGIWVEYGADRREVARFRETGRDQWSVYLRDDSRQMNMQIDLHRKWISLEWPGNPMQDQYRLTGWR